MKRKSVFLLPEEIPYENKGEMAILSGIMESLKTVGEHELAIISSNGSDARYPEEFSNLYHIKSNFLFNIKKTGVISYFFQGLLLILMGILVRYHFIKSRHKSVKKIKSVYRLFVEADTILYGHDNYFADNLNIRFIFISLYAMISRKPVVIPAGSIGPFNQKTLWNRLKRIIIIDKCKIITLRDRPSYEFLKSFNCKCKKVVLTTDLAFSMPPATDSSIDELISFYNLDNNNDLLIAMTPTRYVARYVQEYNQSIMLNTAEKYEAYLDLHRKAIDMLTELKNIRVILIPHSLGPRQIQNDQIVNRDLFNKCKNKDHITLIDEELSSQKIKALMGKMDMLVGGRTHSIIAALGVGTPVMAESSHTRYKTNGILELFGIQNCIYFMERPSPSAFNNRIMMILENRHKYAMRIKSQLDQKVHGLCKKNASLLKDSLTEAERL